MKHYYTAGEARRFLDMDVGAFYYLIETGKIKRITPPGKKRGFYSKQQIEKIGRSEIKAYECGGGGRTIIHESYLGRFG